MFSKSKLAITNQYSDKEDGTFIFHTYKFNVGFFHCKVTIYTSLFYSSVIIKQKSQPL